MKQILNRLKMFAWLVLAPLTSISHGDEYSDLVNKLNQGSFNDKIDVVAQLQTQRDERSLELLKAMMDGRLLAVEDTEKLVIETNAAPAKYLDAVSQEPLALEGAKLDKVRTNNRLRRNIRTAIAALELSSESPARRLAAANNLIKNNESEFEDLIRQAYESEVSGKVKDALAIALALIDINKEDTATRLQAIEVLGTAVDPEAAAVLRRLSARDDNGSFNEADKTIAEAAAAALDKVERKLSFYKTLENLFFGLSLGSVLLLAAVGLAITFGVMGVINMAHGEMIMLGAYTTYVVQLLMPNMIGMSLFVAIPAAFLVSGLVGILIERLVIRHLYGRPLETLLATFGISLVLQQAVRSIFSPLNRQVVTPEWMSGSFEINAALSLTYNRFYIIWFSLIVIALLVFVMRHTFFGLQMRAVTQNRPMAAAMGIRTGWVDALTFGLGSGIAGIGGVALSQLTNVGPNLGQAYIIDSFMVVVFGGVGNIFGTVFAAMGLGIVNKFLEPFAGAVLGKILVLVFIILFIQWRPRGLFALKGRAVEE